MQFLKRFSLLVVVAAIFFAPITVWAEDAALPAESVDAGDADAAPLEVDVAVFDEVVVTADKSALPPVSKNEPKNVDEAIEAGKGFYAAVKDGDARTAVAFALMLLIFGVRRFADFIPSNAWPYVAIGTMVAIAVLDSLLSGASILKVVFDAINVGLASGGAWGLLKPVLKKYVTKGSKEEAPAS